MSTHYIGMAGLHGCMPQTINSYDSIRDAAEGLQNIHGFGKGKLAELKRNLYLEMNINRYGNEYCEIIECDCESPEQHSN
jgi:hypothetical protein